jgi:hypothetical protein
MMQQRQQGPQAGKTIKGGMSNGNVSDKISLAFVYFLDEQQQCV